MFRFRPVAVFAILLLGAAPPALRPGGAGLRFVTDEADAALAVMALEEQGKAPGEADWQRLFASEGYRRLKERELSFKRPFTDESFKAFIAADAAKKQRAPLAATLARWEKTSIGGAEARARAYLPKGTPIRATVYPVIKPATNSFVYDTEKDPAIFLYVDPTRTAAQFENTVAHELHHIGISAACSREKPRDPANAAITPWFGAFGEGLAMLAAAGGPHVHPHAVSPPEDRRRWDRDMANYDADFRRLVDFFSDVQQGRLQGDGIREKGMTFFGVQGPWYTVGWRMASLIETKMGRRELVASFCSPRRFLTDYNRAAATVRPKPLPLWPQSIIDALPPA
jgi:hypothetical protein